MSLTQLRTLTVALLFLSLNACVNNKAHILQPPEDATNCRIISGGWNNMAWIPPHRECDHER